jgi:hypothetical protein
MKTIISETDGFKTLAEVKSMLHPAGYVELKFSTEWDGARRDGSEQVQYRLLLSPLQLKNLKDLL